MVFGHDSFIWTPVQVIKNAETASGRMVFEGVGCSEGYHLEWNPDKGLLGGFDCVEDEDDEGGTGIDFIDDIVDTITEWVSKVTETFQEGFAYITVEDTPIDVRTITKCCNGVPRKFIYGIYQVNAEGSLKGGPRTVGNEVWGAGDKYATFREYRWTPADYQNGNDNGRWNNYQDGALGRTRYDALTDEYQVLADDSSQSIKDFYDEVIIQRIGEDCEDGPFGCMSDTASNYDSNAICPDGSCECGRDESNSDMRMDLSGNCYVEQCTGSDALNRTINNDGSCGPCDDGYYRGSGTGCIEKTTQCQLDTDWSGWSDCENGTQSRTKQKGTPPAGWTFTANSCLPIAFGALGTLTETETEVIDTRTCTTTSGRSDASRALYGDKPQFFEFCEATHDLTLPTSGWMIEGKHNSRQGTSGGSRLGSYWLPAGWKFDFYAQDGTKTGTDEAVTAGKKVCVPLTSSITAIGVNFIGVCEDSNRKSITAGLVEENVRNDAGICGDCITGYEEDNDGKCIESQTDDEEETEEGLPVGWIIGGVAVALGAYMMVR